MKKEEYLLKKIVFLLTFLFFAFSPQIVKCKEQIISDFENVNEWKIQHIKGNTATSILSISPDSIYGKNSILITYRGESAGLDEIEITKETDLDFSNFDRIEFWVKGFSNGNTFCFFMEDDTGRVKEYYFVPDILLYDIFTPEWRRITIKIEPGMLDWKRIKRIGFKINDKANRKKTSTKLQIDCLVGCKGKPELKLRFPDEFKRRKNGVLDVLIITAGIFYEVQRWNLENVLKEEFKGANIKKVRYSYIPWRYKGEITGAFPSFHRKLAKYDVIILRNWDTDAVDHIYQMLIKDYVEAGGNLIILGGYYSFNSAKVENTVIGDLLPFKPSYYFDLKKGIEKLKSEYFSMVNNKDVFYYHKIIPRREADIRIKSSEGDPLFVAWKWREGKVVAIPLTVLGNEKETVNYLPFWKGKDYNKFLKRIINYLTGGKI